jgi:thioredoxin:protein disulfide reductase
MVCPPISTGLRPRLRLAKSLGSRLLIGAALALPVFAQLTPLPPDRAFRFSARALNPQTIEAKFSIADGYYLYRDRISFSIDPAIGLTVAPLPEGKLKEDQFFGRVQTYRGSVIVNLTLKDAVPGQRVAVQAESQGCADIGICYPPQIQRVTVALPAANAAPTRGNESPAKAWFN